MFFFGLMVVDVRFLANKRGFCVLRGAAGCYNNCFIDAGRVRNDPF